MDIGKSFTYTFEDGDWLSKLGLGALIAIVPIVNFAWAGYLIGIIRNVSAGHPRPLPDWSDLGKKFADGLIVAVASTIYALPGFLLLCLPAAFFVLPALVEDRDVQAVVGTVAGITGLFTICFWLLYLLALSFVYPAIQINYARAGAFGACFRVGEIVRVVTRNPGNYLLAWAVTLGVSLVIYPVLGTAGAFLGVIPCIGWLFALALIPVGLVAGVWVGAVSSHLFGQVAAAPAGDGQ